MAQAECSVFFHGKFSPANGLPMDFRHINVCNTSVGITVWKYKFFTKENDTISTQNIFLAANIPSNLELFCKIHEYKRVDLMQGGECFHDTTFRTQNPSIFSFFILFINQPNLCSSRLATSRSRGERAKLCGARSTCFACKNILLIKILARKLI